MSQIDVQISQNLYDNFTPFFNKAVNENITCTDNGDPRNPTNRTRTITFDNLVMMISKQGAEYRLKLSLLSNQSGGTHGGRAQGSAQAVRMATKADLYAAAQRMGVKGRSSMKKTDLEKAVNVRITKGGGENWNNVTCTSSRECKDRNFNMCDMRKNKCVYKW